MIYVGQRRKPVKIRIGDWGEGPQRGSLAESARMNHRNCRHRPTHTEERTLRHVCDATISIYKGPLVAEHPGEWLITLREAARRRFRRRHSPGSQHHRQRAGTNTGPTRNRRNLERLNEAIYRNIIRIQQRLGHPDAEPPHSSCCAPSSLTSTRHPPHRPSPSRTIQELASTE